jgi:methionyl-tRNA formyltransferase
MIIGYFADGPWSHRALKLLLLKKNIRVAFICARYDHPDEALKSLSDLAGIPFVTHSDVNSPDFLRFVSSFGCHLLVSMSFNQIFRKAILDVTPGGVINCHAGKLPFYRGRNVLNWALINDESEFGVTVHYVDEGVDTGDIIGQRSYPITDEDDYESLLERAYEACGDLLVQCIDDIDGGASIRTPQTDIHTLGFYCSARRQGDERINWNQSSRQIFNFVRALCPPGPSARCFLGANEIEVIKVDYLVEAPSFIGIPGAILAKDGRSFLVKTLDSYIRLLSWKADVKLRVGDRLS